MANDSIRGRQVVLRLTNKSGGGVVAGDVVIISSGTAASFTTTTSAAQTADLVGVVLETIAQDALGRVCISGYTPIVNLSGAASLGDTISTHTVAKQAAPAASRGAGSFGEVLGTGTTPAAILWGAPDLGAGGGMATDSLWDAAGDLAYGTGANTGTRLPIGTAGQVLAVNGGATAPEWVAASSGGRTLISEQTPTGTGTVTWSSIAATYKSLEIEGVARSTESAEYSDARLFINNDTTDGNYRNMVEAGHTASTNYISGGDTALLLPGAITGANGTAGYAGYFTIKINQYAGTTFHKCAQARFSVRRDDTQVFNGTSAIFRENTEAVNRIDIVLGSGNWDTGSTFRLYGVA